VARFTKNVRTAPSGNTSVLTASPKSDVPTGNGGKGFAYAEKSALFLLGVTNFTGQDTYYESAEARDSRYVELIRSVAKADPEWVANFLSWLRTSGNIRTAAITGAIEYGRTVSGRAPFDSLTPRAVLRSVLQRADEPSEALGYWLANYGKPLPKWFKRALGDAAKALYNEKSVLKYDSQGAAIRFGDVISLSQVDTTDSPYKAAVFAYAQDRRYDNVDLSRYQGLTTLVDRQVMADIPREEREAFLKDHPDAARLAGHTWESLASWFGGELTATFWESVIPNMGYMALIRNLRNFAKAGISDSYAKFVAEKIADEEAVLSSRQLPLRFLSAYRAVAPQPAGYYGLRTVSEAVQPKYRKLWEPALSKALDISLRSVPELSGDTLVMIDRSGSMSDLLSGNSTVSRYDNAVAFGLALALRAENAVVFAYDDRSDPFTVDYSASLLSNIQRFYKELPIAGGTRTVQVAETLLRRFRGAVNRLVIVTDEQADYYGKSLPDVVPADVTTFTFNVAGYQAAHAPQGRGNFYAVGGLTDSAFAMMQNIEAAGFGSWPWES
jgi:hypothetical protein